jgi:hypothetical protein
MSSLLKQPPCRGARFRRYGRTCNRHGELQKSILASLGLIGASCHDMVAVSPHRLWLILVPESSVALPPKQGEAPCNDAVSANRIIKEPHSSTGRRSATACHASSAREQRRHGADDVRLRATFIPSFDHKVSCWYGYAPFQSVGSKFKNDLRI